MRCQVATKFPSDPLWSRWTQWLPDSKQTASVLLVRYDSNPLHFHHLSFPSPPNTSYSSPFYLLQDVAPTLTFHIPMGWQSCKQKHAEIGSSITWHCLFPRFIYCLHPIPILCDAYCGSATNWLLAETIIKWTPWYSSIFVPPFVVWQSLVLQRWRKYHLLLRGTKMKPKPCLSLIKRTSRQRKKE